MEAINSQKGGRVETGDIVRRLRSHPIENLNNEAADEIERLRAAVRILYEETPVNYETHRTSDWLKKILAISAEPSKGFSCELRTSEG